MESYLFKSLIFLFGYLILTLGESVFEDDNSNRIKEGVIQAAKLIPRQNVHISKWMDNCENEMGPEEWKKIEVIPSQIYPCMRRYLKPKVAQEEIEDSVTRGDLDLVFRKYCGRKEKILNCLYKRLEKIKPCLDEDQIANLNTTKSAVDAGMDFICSESGDKIALFMAEKGRECLSDREAQIKECMTKYFPDVSDALSNIKSILFDHLFITENTCRNFTSAHQCIVEVTSHCEDPTPSNILDSLMTQALKVTPCYQSSDSVHIFHSFVNQLLHPYMLTLLVGVLTATHIIL